MAQQAVQEAEQEAAVVLVASQAVHCLVWLVCCWTDGDHCSRNPLAEVLAVKAGCGTAAAGFRHRRLVTVTPTHSRGRLCMMLLLLLAAVVVLPLAGHWCSGHSMWRWR